MENIPNSISAESEWFVVELMGHIRLAGRVTADERFGGKLSRIDIPGPPADDGSERWVTQWFGAAGVYRITACTEETARRAALVSNPAPVQPWELPKQIPPAVERQRRFEEQEHESDYDATAEGALDGPDDRF